MMTLFDESESFFLNSNQLPLIFSELFKMNNISWQNRYLNQDKEYSHNLYFFNNLWQDLFNNKYEAKIFIDQQSIIELTSIAICYQEGKQERIDYESLKKEALFCVAYDFGKMKKIKSIYYQEYENEIQVIILLNVEKYDDALMDSLLDIEYSIRKRYADLIFQFSYPLASFASKADFIHPKAICIWKRIM